MHTGYILKPTGTQPLGSQAEPSGIVMGDGLEKSISWWPWDQLFCFQPLVGILGQEVPSPSL